MKRKLGNVGRRSIHDFGKGEPNPARCQVERKVLEVCGSSIFNKGRCTHRILQNGSVSKHVLHSATCQRKEGRSNVLKQATHFIKAPGISCCEVDLHNKPVGCGDGAPSKHHKQRWSAHGGCLKDQLGDI
jgi:hypothetical protein